MILKQTGMSRPAYILLALSTAALVAWFGMAGRHQRGRMMKSA